MARLHYTLVKVALGADIDDDDTSITLAAPLKEFGEDNIATISGGDILVLRCGYEILHVTAYTSGATTATVLRGQEGSTATAHNEGDILRHVVTAEDIGGTGGGDIATDTIWDAAGDLVYGTGADAASRLALGAALRVLRVNSGATAPEWADLSTLYAPKATFPVLIGVALSDEATAITTGTGKAYIHAPFAFTLTAVKAELNTVSSSGAVTVDINEGAGAGTSVLSTKLTIDASEETSATAATPAVISDSSIADDARISFDIDGAGTGAKGLKVWLYGTRVLA